MESNGKSVNENNKFVKYATGPVLFGGAGTDVQHFVFQLLHQGSRIVPLDLIVPAISHNEIGEHHEILVANALAQGEGADARQTVAEAAAELSKAGKARPKSAVLSALNSSPAIVRPTPSSSKGRSLHFGYAGGNVRA